MMSHALQSDPEECCGLIVGGDGVRFRRVHRFDNEMSGAGRPSRRCSGATTARAST